MKKLLVAITILLLVGCTNNWEKNIGITSLKWEDSYVIGKIQNKTDKYYSVVITLEGTSGSANIIDTCYIDLKPKEIVDLSCLAYDYDTDYQIEVKNVKYEEKQIPEEPKINTNLSIEQLKYYYSDIYDNHLTMHIGLFNYGNDNYTLEGYPYIDTIEYKEYKKDEIIITYKGKYNNYNCTMKEVYYAKTGKMSALSFSFAKNTQNLDKLIFNFSNSKFITDNSSALQSISIEETLLDNNSINETWKIGNLMFSREEKDSTIYLIAMLNNS